PRHRLDGDEGQQTVLTRERELRVDPLDLDHAADVGVDVETAVGVDLTTGGGCASARAARRSRVGSDAAHASRVVKGEPAVEAAGLAVLQVDLEAENGPDPADRELQVRTEPGARIPLTVTVTGQVAVERVPAHRRDLVEEAGDRHLRSRCLSEPWRRQHRENDEGHYCGNYAPSHRRRPPSVMVNS